MAESIKILLASQYFIYRYMHSRILFYNSYILPNLDYADIVWGDRGNETLLQILQSKAARITLDLDYRLSASFALKKFNWKDLKTRRIINRLLFTYIKCKNNLFHITLKSHITMIYILITLGQSVIIYVKQRRNINEDTGQRLTLPAII